MRSVQIDVPPRIHVGLLSMHANAPRVNGGIGFAADGPQVRITASASDKLVVDDCRQPPMSQQELARLTACLERFVREHQMALGAKIDISGGMLTHVGLGSATAIRIGSLEALALLNDLRATRDALVSASGRGGTSGIGINTYFDGGLVLDLGRPNDGRPFSPSSQVETPRPPSILPSVAMPRWPMLLCIPRKITSKTQNEEISFFRRTTPLPAEASFQATYVALFELYAAVIDRSYQSFCVGVDRMQETAWKHAERLEYGEELEVLDAHLRKAGADCVGLSSLGPMLFCLAAPSQLSCISDAARALGCDVHHTVPANYGRQVFFQDA